MELNEKHPWRKTWSPKRMCVICGKKVIAMLDENNKRKTRLGVSRSRCIDCVKEYEHRINKKSRDRKKG